MHDPLASIYAHCSDKPHSVQRICDSLELGDATGSVQAALEQLVECGIMMRDRDLYLSLAIPATGGR